MDADKPFWDLDEEGRRKAASMTACVACATARCSAVDVVDLDRGSALRSVVTGEAGSSFIVEVKDEDDLLAAGLALVLLLILKTTMASIESCPS
jgi:hypothetical protein